MMVNIVNAENVIKIVNTANLGYTNPVTFEMLMGFLFLLLEGESRLLDNKTYRKNYKINIIN